MILKKEVEGESLVNAPTHVRAADVPNLSRKVIGVTFSQGFKVLVTFCLLIFSIPKTLCLPFFLPHTVHLF